MAVSESYIELLSDLLAPVGHVVFRNMFGGAGVYCDGVMFGLIADEVLYFKANDKTKGAYEDEGQGPFIYEGKTKPVAMSYWRVPERLYDEPEEMADWARTALGVAKASSAKTAKSRTAKSKKR
jgi:DNA transformation protein and related proteins